MGKKTEISLRLDGQKGLCVRWPKCALGWVAKMGGGRMARMAVGWVAKVGLGCTGRALWPICWMAKMLIRLLGRGVCRLFCSAPMPRCTYILHHAFSHFSRFSRFSHFSRFIIILFCWYCPGLWVVLSKWALGGAVEIRCRLDCQKGLCAWWAK